MPEPSALREAHEQLAREAMDHLEAYRLATEGQLDPGERVRLEYARRAMHNLLRMAAEWEHALDDALEREREAGYEVEFDA